MRRKILIAEQSDTTRGIAENVLRQNGYEVISVSNGDKMLEVLELSRPHVMLVDFSMTVKGKRSLLERLQQERLTSSIPYLIIADENDKSVSYPEEIVVTRPLDPKELVLKVSVIVGAIEARANDDELNPLDEGSLEDDLLDQALGLDKIDVTDSEILDNSTVTKKKGTKAVEKMIGMEHDHELEVEEDSQGNKIESGQIGDEDSEAGKHNKKSAHHASKTGKLEILSDQDQFGLGNEALLERDSATGHHDYEWFIKEMKKDNTPGQAKPAGRESQEPKASVLVDTVPAPAKKKSDSGKLKSEKENGGGVDRFIEDFKKEVEKFADTGTAAPAKALKAAVQKVHVSTAPTLADGIGNVSIDQVEVFTRQFVSALAEKVAEKIASKIDAQKLLSLIKNEIVSKNQKQ